MSFIDNNLEHNYRPAKLVIVTNAEEAFPLMFLVCLLHQFCNISGVEHLNLDNPALTSTPMCGQRCLFNTPLQKETTPKHQKENDM